MTVNHVMKEEEEGIEEEVKMNNNPKSYTQYLSLATQMILSFLAAIFLGKWLDEKLKLSFPFFTISLLIFIFIAILYKIIKDNSISK